MSLILKAVRLCALLGALSILAVSAVPNLAVAQLHDSPVVCEGKGHDCHYELPNGQIEHYKQIS